MSNNIAVYNFKGGVGKTTTTLNLGFELSKSFKVLLIDGDPQCNLTNVLVPNGHKSPSLHDITKKILHEQTPTIQPVEVHPYLHLIPGDYQMVEMESNHHFIQFGHEIIRKLFMHINRDYDLILIDCPTNFGIYVKSILQNINSVLIPTVPDAFSITGVQTLIKHLTSMNTIRPLNILGIFFNMYREDRIQSRNVLHFAQQIFGKILLNTTISTSIKLREATSQGSSIADYMPDHKITSEFSGLCDEIITKLFELKTLNTSDLTKKLRELDPANEL